MLMCDILCAVLLLCVVAVSWTLASEWREALLEALRNWIVCWFAHLMDISHLYSLSLSFYDFLLNYCYRLSSHTYMDFDQWECKLFGDPIYVMHSIGFICGWSVLSYFSHFYHILWFTFL